MTIVSAASLPNHGPEAPFRSFRSPRRPLSLAHMQTASGPQRHFPMVQLADDPPLGRILVVMDQASLALDVQRILREAGYLVVGPAETAEDVDRMTAQRLIDGAVVDLQLAGGIAKAVADRLARKGIPFVWLTGDTRGAALDSLPWGYGEAPAVPKPITGENLVQSLERALTSAKRKSTFYPVPPPQPVWPRVFPQL